MTDEQRISLIRVWSEWFYEHTESFEGELALSLAYLYPAMAKDLQIELESTSPLVTLLLREKVPLEDPIWTYIDINDS